MPTSSRILIVGGGIASFVAGIELRRQLPRAEITILSAANEQTLGGHLASWDEHGYPIEHGLHALFGFYDNILPLLRRLGVIENFTRSPKHTFVFERDELHRFDLKTWLATYRGFSPSEKLGLAAAVPAFSRLMADVARDGHEVFRAYDRYDLREWARRSGVPRSLVESNFCQQFYDAAFNAPHELSAAVGLSSVYNIFAKPWHFYFNLPSRDALISPLREHFERVCGGTVELATRLERVLLDASGRRVVGLEMLDLASHRRHTVTADEYVLALGLEDFKAVDFGAARERYAYFRDIHRLTTVSSVSLQAWFREDVVPKGIDSLICGLPEPFSIVCPISRVRSVPPARALPLPHEIIATGPEAGFEDVSDEKLIGDFLARLSRLGFRIPENRADFHVTMRRNREPAHRYLLTRPGELALRPTHESPLENLCLAGAWVRNDFALPCVDAAAQGANAVAEIIAKRSRKTAETREIAGFRGMPIGSPLVMPAPYHFPKSTGSLFVVDVDRTRLREEVSPLLQLLPGFTGKALLALFRHEDVHSPRDPSGGRYSYNEIVLSAFVRHRRRPGTRGSAFAPAVGLYPLVLYVDDDAAMAAGREVYGFPKKMATIALGESHLTVTRVGMAPGAPPGSVSPIELLSGEWSAADERDRDASLADDGPPLLKRLVRVVSGVTPGSLPAGPLQSLLSAPFFNTRDLLDPRASLSSEAHARSSLRELTRTPLANVDLRATRRLRDCAVRIGASQNDQLYKLLPSDHLELRARHGLHVELGFTLSGAEVFPS